MILPPVPKELEERGIQISSSNGSLQYTCQLHLGASKAFLKPSQV